MPKLVEQRGSAPTRKVQVSSLTGLGVGAVGAPVVITWIWKLVSDEPMPLEVAVALGGMATWAVQTLVAYVTKNRATDQGA